MEHLAFRTADRMQPAITVNIMIARNLMGMTRLSRQVFDCVPELLFTDYELSFLDDAPREFRLSGPERLGPMLRLGTHLEGYRDRKHDLGSGHQLIWHGYDAKTKTT